MLSLQSKLDLIARDRAVIALLRELAARGLCEGDRVRHAQTGESGVLNVERDDTEPRVVVVLDCGARAAFDSFWRRA